MKHAQLVALAALSSLLLLPVSAHAGCDEVKIRLYQGEGASFHAYGDTITVPNGKEFKVQVYVARGSKTPIPAAARITYAPQLGVQGTQPKKVAEVIRFKAQNSSDLDNGRLRAESIAVGEATLGFEITGVAKGSLDDVSSACLKGPIAIEVADGSGAAAGSAGEEAAAEVSEDAVDACQDAVAEKAEDEFASPGGTVTLYGDANFRGTSKSFDEDVPQLDKYRLNDAVSSVKLGEGCQATLYADEYFSGDSMGVRMDIDTLARTSLGNDTTSSIEIDCQGSTSPELNFRSQVEAEESSPGRALISGQVSISGVSSGEYTYECTVDTDTNRVLSLSYSPKR